MRVRHKEADYEEVKVYGRAEHRCSVGASARAWHIGRLSQPRHQRSNVLQVDGVVRWDECAGRPQTQDA